MMNGMIVMSFLIIDLRRCFTRVISFGGVYVTCCEFLIIMLWAMRWYVMWFWSKSRALLPYYCTIITVVSDFSISASHFDDPRFCFTSAWKDERKNKISANGSIHSKVHSKGWIHERCSGCMLLPRVPNERSSRQRRKCRRLNKVHLLLK